MTTNPKQTVAVLSPQAQLARQRKHALREIVSIVPAIALGTTSTCYALGLTYPGWHVTFAGVLTGAQRGGINRWFGGYSRDLYDSGSDVSGCQGLLETADLQGEQMTRIALAIEVEQGPLQPFATAIG